MLDTLPDARIAGVPVPSKLTHARQAYTGAEPEALNCDKVDSAVAMVPELSGSVSVLSVFPEGLAIVNVPVPEGLPERVILLIRTGPFHYGHEACGF